MGCVASSSLNPDMPPSDTSSLPKVLLLGTGESGKSTLFKQLCMWSGKEMSDTERKSSVRIVHRNCLRSILDLVEGARGMDVEVNTFISDDEFEQLEMAEAMKSELTPELVELISRVWRDPLVQKTYSQRAAFSLNDNADFFCDHIHRLSAADYVPTDDDVLKCYVRTTGLHKTALRVGDDWFELVDVGGRRSERRKWVHLFENVHAILYVVSLADYKVVPDADDPHSEGGISESLTIFHDVCNNRFLLTTPIVLFLNKSDVFKEDIKTTPLHAAFPEFGATRLQYDENIQFLQDKFVGVTENFSRRKHIDVHVTDSTDVAGFTKVFDSVKEFVLNSSLAKEVV